MRKNMTWDELIKMIERNTYHIEHDYLDPYDRSVAGEEVIDVVPVSFVTSLIYHIAIGKTVVEPPR